MSLKRTFVRRAVAGALMCGVAAAPAVAAPSCLTPSELEAQQALKMHTELMVIGLTCIRDGVSAFPHYGRFTAKHADAIRSYEAVMVGYMRKNFRDNPTRRFDKMRTDLANETAQSVIKMTPETFCTTNIAKLEQMIGFGPADFRAAALEAARVDTGTPMCVTAVASDSPARGTLAENQQDGKKSKTTR